MQGSSLVQHHCRHIHVPTGLHLSTSGQLSNTLQTNQLDLSRISSFVRAVLISLDGAITPVEAWVLEFGVPRMALSK